MKETDNPKKVDTDKIVQWLSLRLKLCKSSLKSLTKEHRFIKADSRTHKIKKATDNGINPSMALKGEYYKLAAR